MTFEFAWQNIVKHEGSEFKQKLGKPFTYQVSGNTIFPSTTDVQIPKSQFEKAWARMPVKGPGEFQDLFGPSYLFGILTDSRICN